MIELTMPEERSNYNLRDPIDSYQTDSGQTDETVGMRNQRIFIARLKDYCEYAHTVASYAKNQASFMKSKLEEMVEPMEELKKGVLSEATPKYLKALEKGKATEKIDNDFKDMLYTLIPYKDFLDVQTTYVMHEKGSKNHINDLKSELSDVKIRSLIEEEKRGELDKSAQDLISSTYKRLGLDNLEEEYSANPTDETLNKILAKTRGNVKEYCIVFKVPAKESETMSPFMLTRAEVTIAANTRFFKRLEKIKGSYL